MRRNFQFVKDVGVRLVSYELNTYYLGFTVLRFFRVPRRILFVYEKSGGEAVGAEQ